MGLQTQTSTTLSQHFGCWSTLQAAEHLPQRRCQKKHLHRPCQVAMAGLQIQTAPLAPARPPKTVQMWPSHQPLHPPRGRATRSAELQQASQQSDVSFTHTNACSFKQYCLFLLLLFFISLCIDELKVLLVSMSFCLSMHCFLYIPNLPLLPAWSVATTLTAFPQTVYIPKKSTISKSKSATGAAGL